MKLANCYRMIQYSQITYFCKTHMDDIQRTTTNWDSIICKSPGVYLESERDEHIIKCAWMGKECTQPAVDWAYKIYTGWQGMQVQKKCYHCLEHTPPPPQEEEE